MPGIPVPTPFTGSVAGLMPWVVLPTITVTRPNNVTAYVAGGVFGPAVDARIEIPAVGQAGQIVNLRLKAVLNDGTGTGVAMNGIIFLSQPPTVLADQSPFALTDADIALIPNIESNALGFNLAFTGGVGSLAFYNITAGAAGRRASLPALSGLRLTGTSLWLYVFVSAAYTPLANGVMTLVPGVQRVA